MTLPCVEKYNLSSGILESARLALSAVKTRFIAQPAIAYVSDRGNRQRQNRRHRQWFSYICASKCQHEINERTIIIYLYRTSLPQ